VPPRRLIRWKSFWLGILVLGFLGWAWVDSFRHEATVAEGTWNVSSATGGVMMFAFGHPVYDFKMEYDPIQSDWYAEWSAIQPLFWFQRPEPVDGNWHERAVAARNARELYPAYMENWPLSRWMVFIPYWFILLVACIPWAAFLAWRWNKQRKLTA